MKSIPRMSLFAVIVATVATIGIVGAYSSEQISDNLSSQDSSSIMGHVTLVVTDENGYVKAYRQSDNAIVHNGLDDMVDGLFPDLSGANTNYDWIAIGDDNTAATNSNTALGNELTTACDRSAGTFSKTSPSNGAITVSVSAVFDGDNCAANGIDEAGVFDTSTDGGGNMFARNTFTSVNLGAGDTLTINWDFLFSDT